MTIPSHHLILYFISLTFLQYSFIQSALDPRDAPVYLSHFCSTNKTFTSNSPYHLSLTTLLSSLSSHASGSLEFFNITIHGLFLCREDVTSQICKTCLAMAIQKLASRCSFSKEAIIWYHECLVRYSNRSFFSALEDWPRLNLVNSSLISDSSEHGNVGWFLANTLHEATSYGGGRRNTRRLEEIRDENGDLSGGSNQKVYCLVQCSPDLRSGDCRRCLEDMMGNIPMCWLGRQGRMVIYPSCSLMFGFRLFYREVEDEHAREARHPSFSTDGDKEDSVAQGERKDKYQRTIVMVVVPVVVPGMLYYFVFYLIRRKSRKRYAILKQNYGNEGTTLESLQYDFATIEATTNRFSYGNRIGRGGFGEVYLGTLPNGQKNSCKETLWDF